MRSSMKLHIIIRLKESLHSFSTSACYLHHVQELYAICIVLLLFRQTAHLVSWIFIYDMDVNMILVDSFI